MLAQALDVGEFVDGVVGIVFLVEHLGEDFLRLVELVEVDVGIAAAPAQEVDEVLDVLGQLVILAFLPFQQLLPRSLQQDIHL